MLPALPRFAPVVINRAHECSSRLEVVADRSKILERIKRYLVKDVWVDHHRPVKAQNQGVAIGFGIGDLRSTDIARRTGLIFYKNLLT